MGASGWCDVSCKISGGKLQGDQWGKMCEWEAGACAFPYFASWSDEEQCDTYCATKSGVLDVDTFQCLYTNMT